MNILKTLLKQSFCDFYDLLRNHLNNYGHEIEYSLYIKDKDNLSIPCKLSDFVQGQEEIIVDLSPSNNKISSSTIDEKVYENKLRYDKNTVNARNETKCFLCFKLLFKKAFYTLHYPVVIIGYARQKIRIAIYPKMKCRIVFNNDEMHS
jgi:hypothetical protein